MNAICGVYYKGGINNLNESEAVMTELGKYRFDKSGTFKEEPLFLGCHQKCVVPESLEETLPFEESNGPLVITADATIYNRDELLSQLPISKEQTNVPDSILVLEAYKKWGIACPEKLVGDFAFAIWDKSKKELFCARDHVGARTFYYYDDAGIFAFSTLINPLFKIQGINKELNDTYIADYLAIASVRHEIDANITLYRNIHQLPPAHAMLIRQNSIRKWRYWEIKKTKEIHFNTDEEYEEAFRRLFADAVRCRLRSINKVGIMLSGGLDSCSVACFAAKELEQRNAKLYSFTQVPMEGYQDWLPDTQLADEREYVDEICGSEGNIEPHYIASEGRSPVTEIDTNLEIFEQPYKMHSNIYWVNEIHRAASDMGIGILLNGQGGNATISWGDFYAYQTHLLKAGQLGRLVTETNAYSKLRHLSPVKLFLNAVLNVAPYFVKVFVHKARKGKDYFKLLSPINPEFYSRMNEKKRLRKYNIDQLFMDHTDSLDQRLRMLSDSRLTHLSAIDTKLALAFGIEKRDPTRDKRIIEFCINLPENQWVRDGKERRFIRCAMNGLMPDKIRLNTTVRGKQAADCVQRMIPEWDRISQEIATIGQSELERKYLDIPKIQQVLCKNRELQFDSAGSQGITLLIRALIFSRFLRGIESQKG